MSVQAVLHPDLLLVPPLDLPLRLRLASGQYGALRPKPLPDAPQCFSTQIIPADDPNNPTGQDAGYVNQLHEAVDLAATAGDCVYAAYAGRIVEQAVEPGDREGAQRGHTSRIVLGALLGAAQRD